MKSPSKYPKRQSGAARVWRRRSQFDNMEQIRYTCAKRIGPAARKTMAKAGKATGNCPLHPPCGLHRRRFFVE